MTQESMGQLGDSVDLLDQSQLIFTGHAHMYAVTRLVNRDLVCLG